MQRTKVAYLLTTAALFLIYAREVLDMILDQIGDTSLKFYRWPGTTFLFKKYLFSYYFKDRDCFILPNVCSNYYCTRLRPRAWNKVHVSHVDDRDPDI